VIAIISFIHVSYLINKAHSSDAFSGIWGHKSNEQKSLKFVASQTVLCIFCLHSSKNAKYYNKSGAILLSINNCVTVSLNVVKGYLL